MREPSYAMLSRERTFAGNLASFETRSASRIA